LAEHVIDATRIHHHWDNALEPTLRITSGDVVHYDLAMAGRGQVERTSRFEDTRFDFDTLYNLLGPVYVEGAGPATRSRSRSSASPRATGDGA
jgi:acetamidase/formamidase